MTGTATDVPASSGASDAEAAPRATRARRRIDRRDAVSIGALVALIAIPVRGLFRYQGSPMEEGFMLTFPEQVLHGQIPNRDFLHLYGPGSLWVLAAVFGVFGASLAAERLVGLLQHLGIITGVYALARPWGRLVATVCALWSALLILFPIGLTALAWNGGVAFGLWAIWAGLRSRQPAGSSPADGDDGMVDWGGAGARAGLAADVGVERRVRRQLVIAGVLASLALLYRPDLVLAVLLGLGAALWGVGWRRLRWLAAGLAVAVVGYAVQVALAGPGHAFSGMVIDPVFRLRGGRTLPVPPSWGTLNGTLQRAGLYRRSDWPFPTPFQAHQIFLWFWLMVASTVFVAAVGIWAVRRRPGSYRGRVLLAAGLFGIGLITQAFQRVDTAHLSWVSCVSMALVPAAVAELVLSWRAKRTSAGRGESGSVARWLGGTIGIGLAVVVLFAAIPDFTVRSYVDLSEQTFNHHRFGVPVSRNGRNFYLPNQARAEGAQAVMDALDRHHPRDGQRLFVGTADLRRTPYSDAFLYFLYPKLDPATYYIEMDPFDSRRGLRLPGDVASADWLILSHIWDTWNEPNDSRHYGSAAANRVVRRHFCRIGQYGRLDDGTPMYLLYRKCR